MRFPFCSTMMCSPLNDVLALKHGLKFPDPIQIHNRTATDAQKILRVKLRPERIQRFPQDVAFFTDVNRDVVARRFDGIDVGNLNYHDFFIGLYREAG